MMMKFHVMIALLYGLIALVCGNAGLITTKTRIFSKFLGGDDLTLVAIVTASEATLSVTTASASIGTEVLVTPGVFLSTVQPNHALPYIVTLTSTTTPTSTSSAAVGGLMSSFSPNDVPPYTLTTTSTTSIVTTVTKPIQTMLDRHDPGPQCNAAHDTNSSPARTGLATSDTVSLLSAQSRRAGMRSTQIHIGRSETQASNIQLRSRGLSTTPPPSLPG
ncbi:unnamed protein product [Diplocarpon coronariae]